ncbi:low molecular weight protein-tyrosine-phosphatase [Nemorincola caseinilytica]|uniref:protein-tyrosine-phosphatase n=1 Tax=Nemorincola caseinilytica TaxID=2054315 RepID=A0ABP8N3A8_9BACT
MRILMVCLGNICRSPIAEGVLRHKIEQKGLNWTVDSAGTNSYHTGEAPHRFSQKVCLANGIDISCQRARTFTPADLQRYDKIYVFAEDVLRDLGRIAGRHSDLSRVEYFLNELTPGSNASVPDPWYGDETGYLPVYDLINRACDAIIEKYGK